MTGRGKSSRQQRRSPDTAALTPLTAAPHLHPQLHSYTAQWTSADLLNCRGRCNKTLRRTSQPSPATSTSTRNFLVRFLDRVART